MTVADYTKTVALVNRLILKKGESITVRRKVDGTPPDSTMPWRIGTPTFLDFTSSGVFFPNGIRGPFTLARHRDSDVTSSDIICYIPGDAMWFVDTDGSTNKTLRLDLTDTVLTSHGVAYSVANCDYLQPAGDPLFYEARLKR